MIGRVLQYLPDGSGYHCAPVTLRVTDTSLTVRVTIGVSGGRWPRDGNPTRQRGSSGLMVDFISRSCRGHNGLLSVGIRQSARVDDWPCTAIPP
jgi:hypothetical protein